MLTAMEQVFKLPELLEIILLDLSQKDVLFSQRVSTQFRDTISDSSKLQQALFLLPDWDRGTHAPNAHVACRQGGQSPQNNRLLLKAFAHYPTISPVKPEYDDDTLSSGQQDRRRKSPGSWDVNISWPSDAAPICKAAVYYPEASWKRMFLSQPPVTELRLVRRWQLSIKPAIIENLGITMGVLVEATSKTQPNWHRSYISSDGDWHFEGNIKCISCEG